MLAASFVIVDFHSPASSANLRCAAILSGGTDGLIPLTDLMKSLSCLRNVLDATVNWIDRDNLWCKVDLLSE